jgi:hypothetical protein
LKGSDRKAYLGPGNQKEERWGGEIKGKSTKIGLHLLYGRINYTQTDKIYPKNTNNLMLYILSPCIKSYDGKYLENLENRDDLASLWFDFGWAP